MKYFMPMVAIWVICSAIIAMANRYDDLQTKKLVLEQQEQIKKLTDKVEKMDSLLNQMASSRF